MGLLTFISKLIGNDKSSTVVKSSSALHPEDASTAAIRNDLHSPTIAGNQNVSVSASSFGVSNSYKLQVENFTTSQNYHVKATEVTTNNNLNKTSPPGNLLLKAVSLHKSGLLEQAEVIYLQLINEDPLNADAFQYIGMLKNQQGDTENSIHFFKKALSISPENFSALSNLGKTFLELKQYEYALDHFNRALEIKSDSAQLWNNRANALLCMKRNEEACESYENALKIDSNYFDAIFNLGNIFLSMRRYEDAENIYRKALNIQPAHAETHNFLGCVLKLTNRDMEAETCFRTSLSLNPNLSEAHRNLASLLNSKNDLIGAEESLRNAILVKADYFEAYADLGFLLGSKNLRTEAKTCCQKAIEINPACAEAHHFLALQLVATGNLEEAEVSFNRALTVNPEYVEALVNFGVLLEELKRFKEAESCYKKALAIAPDTVAPEMNLGLLFLKQGFFKDGWHHFESRYRFFGEALNKIPDSHSKKWSGESLFDKTFLLWPEQGFGDYIQFIRYATLLRSAGVRKITLFCPDPLKALLETVDDVDEIITESCELKKYDFWSCPMSLPLHFGTTEESIPITIPYVHALPERLSKWSSRLSSQTFKVGLVWKGNAQHTNDSNRSIPSLVALAPFWTVPDVTFYSLQKWQGEEEAASHSDVNQKIEHFGSDIGDFGDTAAIIQHLDLVICVDTAIAHLAGAMGKNCWVLLPAGGTDWRWLQNRCDSPWYPSGMRLFRQTKKGDWSQVILEVTRELSTIAVNCAKLASGLN